MKLSIRTLVLSIIFSFISILTKIIYPITITENYKLYNIAYDDAILFLIFSILYYILIDLIKNNYKKIYLFKEKHNSKKISDKTYYIFIIIVVSIVSIIGFCLTYTETLTENTNVIWNNILNNTLDNHHPITNTLFLLPGIYIYKLTNILNLGLITNELILMVFNIMVYSILNCYIFKKTKNIKFLLFSLIWTMLLPINFVFQSTLWKDTYFVDFSILLLIMLYEIIDTNFKVLNNKLFLLTFMIVCIITCLIRSNAFAPFCLLFALSLMCYKKVTPKYLLTLLYIIVIYMGLSNIILAKFYISNSSKAETSAIQLSFISRIINDNFYMDASDMNFIEKIIPINKIKENYNPNCIDSIKFNSEFNDNLFNKEYNNFKKISNKYIKKYPKEFINTYLISTYQYWSLYTPDYTAGNIWYIITKTPVLNLITCPIIYLILYLIFAYKLRKDNYWLLYIFIFGIYITIYCCAPINISIRYLYIIFPAFVIMIMPFIKRKK